MILELKNVCEKAGLMMNYSKSKILSNSSETEIVLGGGSIETVDEVLYLGQWVSLENETEKEIYKRISLVWKKF